MTAIPDDIMKLARKAIMAEVRPEVRWQYVDGRCDQFAVVRAVAKAIYAERTRCANIAKSHGAFVPVFDGEQLLHVVNAVAEIIAKDILNSSTVPQAPLSVDEKSRDAALPSVSAPSAGQE